jgi:glycosyltransferase involved in cell wall biosynthesis
MPTLTIITINYNNAVSLQKTMQSVLGQIATDFEYIVVDGGSTDDSVNIIKNEEVRIKNGEVSLKPDYFNWISEPDNGIYHAMNKGIRMAKGDYVQFVNSGDWLVNAEVTERMLRTFSIPHSPFSILYGNMLKVMRDGSILYNRRIGDISMLTFYRGTINHSCAYIRRDLFEKYGYYDESLKIVSDWKFYLIVVGLHNEPVEYADIDVTYFDMTGISETNHELDKRERRQVLQELLPTSVLKDYDKYAFSIDQVSRINRYAITRKVFYFVERCLFKYEKRLAKRRREHLFL